jgi:aerobic carbon-monoxide dehydrogenase medium subunit
MFAAQFEYTAPESLGEAVRLLKGNAHAKILAGGQSLLSEMKLRRASPATLVDLRKIQELRGVLHRETSGGVRIGAMTTCAEIAGDRYITGKYHALAEAASRIGDPQIRNRGTLGGSLAYGGPASDLAAAVLAIEATIMILGRNGIREIPADDFFVDASTRVLDQSEILISVDLQLPIEEMGSAYQKVKNPANQQAIAGVAAKIVRARDGRIGKCRLAITGVTDRSMRLRQVEAMLEGKELTADNVAAAARRAAEGLTCVSDLYASAEYRAYLAVAITHKAVASAGRRAGFSDAEK